MISSKDKKTGSVEFLDYDGTYNELADNAVAKFRSPDSLKYSYEYKWDDIPDKGNCSETQQIVNRFGNYEDWETQDSMKVISGMIDSTEDFLIKFNYGNYVVPDGDGTDDHYTEESERLDRRDALEIIGEDSDFESVVEMTYNEATHYGNFLDIQFGQGDIIDLGRYVYLIKRVEGFYYKLFKHADKSLIADINYTYGLDYVGINDVFYQAKDKALELWRDITKI